MAVLALHRCCFKVNMLFHSEFACSLERRWSTPISRDEKVSSEFVSRSNHLKVDVHCAQVAIDIRVYQAEMIMRLLAGLRLVQY